MATLIYSAIASLDGYVEDADGRFDPEAVRRLKAAAPDDLTVGGADLAGQALRAGLVDELHLFAVPVAVGGAKRWLPQDVHLDLQLADTHPFANGVLYANYGLKG